jgi:two-component system phosphate regulon sensor histidine kinase PhoR
MTLKSPIFRKLLWNACLLIAATLFVLNFYLSRYMAQRQVESVQQRLAAQVRILSAELGNFPRPQLQEWAKAVGAQAQARVTLVDPGGVVLADSQHDHAAMDNHAMRPEVRQAVQGGIGMAIRHSATLNRDLCYVAMAVTYGGKPGHVLRLAVPLEDIDAAIAAVRWRILGASLAAAVVALGIAYFFSRSFTRRIGRLSAFAEGLVDANFSESPLPAAEDELGALARSLNSMTRQLRDLVERLSLEATRRQAILSSMVEGVLAVDNELRVTFCNDAFARAVGFSSPVPERLPLLELVRDPGLLDMLHRVLVSGESMKQRLRPPAAEGRTFEAQAAPLAAPPRRGAIVILHDVSDLERLERVRKDFVANVSHELRTPLTAIRGYCETLLDGALEDQEHNRKFLYIIRAHADHLNHIASDLLTLSQLESGKSVLEPKPVSIRGALETALSTVEAQARVRDVKLICGKLEDAHVLGDPLRLEQALANLLDNAVKFNRPGGEVRVEARHVPDGKIQVSLADAGIGIPSTDLARIFERFYCVDKARSREVGGTGLGLSIVKHIVESMNGTVTVESLLGKGSKFTVYLPTCQRV